MWESPVKDTDICKLLCAEQLRVDKMIPKRMAKARVSTALTQRAIYRGTLRCCAGAAEMQKDDPECWVNFVH